MKFLFLLIAYLNISFIINQENFCDLNHFCDNCTYCGNNNDNYCSCNFFNIYCLNSDSSKIVSYDFLRNYDGCIESNENKEVCGESDIFLSNGESKTISFPSTNSSNILCYYNFRKSDLSNTNKMSVLIRKDGLDFPQFNLYYLTYNNNSLNKNGGVSSSNARESLEITQNNCNKYSIYLHIEEPKYLDELSMTFYFIEDSNSETTIPTTVPTTPTRNRINTESSSSNTGLIIGLIVGGIVLIIGIIITAFLINNYRKKNKSSSVVVNSSINDTNNYNYTEFYNIINTNKGKIDNLFKTELMPKIYTKGNTINDNYNCTICMEEFVDNLSSVLTTKCGHTFHYKCFKNWAYKNIICPKCPNCNYLILGPESNINLENISVPADYTLQGPNNTTLGLTQ